MRIEYNILWVEDVKSWYDDNLELAEDYLEDLGFRLTSKRCKNFDEVKHEYEQNKLKEYDLLLVDYSLAGSPNGDEIINFIRNQKDNPILTDVIFYSNDIQSVRDSIKKHELEGVYTSHRTDFTDKFELVVDTTIKKIQDVNAMRGLIMAETSELDAKMTTIVSQFIEKGGENAEILSNYIYEKVEKLISDSQVDYNSFKKKNDIKGIINSPLFIAMIGAKCIQKIIRLLSDKELSDLSNFTNEYSTDVISVRNQFAHVEEKIDKDGVKRLISHKTGREEVFTGDRCIEIRKTLIDYDEKLILLEGKI